MAQQLRPKSSDEKYFETKIQVRSMKNLNKLKINIF